MLGLLTSLKVYCRYTSVRISSSYSHPHPNGPRYHLPEEDKQTIGPVDGDDGLAPFESVHYADGHFGGVELHGKVTSLYQGSLYKARTYIRDVNIPYFPDVRQLAQTFQIMAGKPLRG